MDRFQIQGGQPLHGRVRISGGQECRPAHSLCRPARRCTPSLAQTYHPFGDVATMRKLLEGHGACAVSGMLQSIDGQENLTLQADRISRSRPLYEARQDHARLGARARPMLARFGEALVSLPGGCAIGQRPVDQHIKASPPWGRRSRSTMATSRHALVGSRVPAFLPTWSPSPVPRTS